MQQILLPFPPLSATTSRPVIPMSILRNQCKFYQQKISVLSIIITLTTSADNSTTKPLLATNLLESIL